LTQTSTDSSNEGRRFFDRGRSLWTVRIAQGDCQVTSDENVVMTTILGSCVAACINDPVAGIGGMNHFLLPHDNTHKGLDEDQLSLRYGSYSMEVLINDILSRGGERQRLEAKLFGGANVMKSISDGVGHRNAEFIENFMRREGLSIVSQNMRGTNPRRIEYFPVSGRARMMQLTDKSEQEIFSQEAQRKVRAEVAESGSIELFD